MLPQNAAARLKPDGAPVWRKESAKIFSQTEANGNSTMFKTEVSMPYNKKHHVYDSELTALYRMPPNLLPKDGTVRWLFTRSLRIFQYLNFKYLTSDKKNIFRKKRPEERYLTCLHNY